jgi:hypothetical protein
MALLLKENKNSKIQNSFPDIFCLTGKNTNSLFSLDFLIFNWIFHSFKHAEAAIEGSPLPCIDSYFFARHQQRARYLLGQQKSPRILF